MLFSSLIFLQIFLPIVFFTALFLKKRSVNFFLLAASLFFYSWGEHYYTVLLIFSIGVNYQLGLFISRAEKTERKIFLATGIVLNLFILGYFKYTQFIISIINYFLPQPVSADIGPMPVGISFFTFQAISYIADVYRKQIPCEKNPVSLGLYIAFFPQLIAGPIIKYHDVAAQLNERQITLSGTAFGIRRFVWGLSKKVILANELAIVANHVFKSVNINLSMPAAWLGLFAYTMQIYFDFSGYSDMAIGLGRMFGFKYAENFNYPYLSLSIREFWKRWHISLSTWFKEYLYIPLGGSRGSSCHTARNLGIVFLATGIWHGASWNFIVWGMYHGFFVILEHFLDKLSMKRLKPLSFLYSAMVIMLGWIIFRCNSLQDVSTYIKTLFVFGEDDAKLYFRWLTPYYILTFSAAAFFCGPHQLLQPVREYISDEHVHGVDLLLIPLLLLFCLVKLGANTYNPFIYFRF